MGAGGAVSVKRRTEEDNSKVEIEYFSKEEEARAAACKGERCCALCNAVDHV
jgi:hypothetical protein